MNAKPLPLLAAGALGCAAGIVLCWLLPGGFRGRVSPGPNPAAEVDRDLAVSKVCSGLLDASTDAFERGDSGGGRNLLFAAMSHPAASPRQFEESVTFAISRAAVPETPLLMKFEMLQGTAAKVLERAGVAKDPQELSQVFGMRDKLAGLQQDLVNDAGSALLARINKISDDPPDSLLRNLAASAEWRDYAVAKRFAPAGWVQPDEIGRSVAELVKRVESSIPSKEEIEKLMPEADVNPAGEDAKPGPIETEKVKLSKRLKGVAGDEVLAIPKVLGDPLLSEQYENLVADMVTAVRECEAVQLKAYNLWALNRIHTSEAASGWEGVLAPVDPAYLQNVVAALYGDVSRKRLDSETDPTQRAAKVRVMIRQVKVKPANF